MLAGIPFGLHEIDDARMARPDWVVTRPILSGICGSDAKLVLGDFNTGDIDNPMAAFSSLPHVPGHEVVAEVVALGPEARGLDVGQRVVLNPWLTCGPRGITPPCPPCQAGRPEPVLELHQGRPRSGRPRGRHHGGPRGLGRAARGARLHAHPGPRRHLRRGRRARRPVLGVLPRHRPAPAAALGAGARLRGRRPRPDQRRHPQVPLPGRGGRRRGPLRGPARDGAALRRLRRLRPRTPAGPRRGAGRVVRRRPAPSARRAPRHASRPHRRRLRLHRQGGDTRGGRARAGRARAGSSTPASPPPNDGSPPPSTSRRSPSRGRTPSAWRTSRDGGSTPSRTTSSSSTRAGSTSPRC